MAAVAFQADPAPIGAHSLWLTNSEFIQNAVMRRYHGLWEEEPRLLSWAEALGVMRRAPTTQVVRRLPSGILRSVTLYQMVTM